MLPKYYCHKERPLNDVGNFPNLGVFLICRIMSQALPTSVALPDDVVYSKSLASCNFKGFKRLMILEQGNLNI